MKTASEIILLIQHDLKHHHRLSEQSLKMIREYDILSVFKDTPVISEHAVCGWVAVTDALPKALQTVWLTNGKGWCCLGCLVEDAEGWHWAESNGVIYIENGEIVSECESEDLDVNYWHELPKPPCH